MLIRSWSNPIVAYRDLTSVFPSSIEDDHCAPLHFLRLRSREPFMPSYAASPCLASISARPPHLSEPRLTNPISTANSPHGKNRGMWYTSRIRRYYIDYPGASRNVSARARLACLCRTFHFRRARTLAPFPRQIEIAILIGI